MAKKATTEKKVVKVTDKSPDSVISKPRVTEKASMKAESNVYTFNVAVKANKNEVKKAIFAKYKVKPVKVNIVTIPRKVTFLKGQMGSKGGGKKALVYLKKGDKIDFV